MSLKEIRGYLEKEVKTYGCVCLAWTTPSAWHPVRAPQSPSLYAIAFCKLALWMFHKDVSPSGFNSSYSPK